MIIIAIALSSPFILYIASEIRKHRRKRHVRELWRQSKASHLNKALRSPSAHHPHRRIDAPAPRTWNSPNGNSRAVQARINQLRQIYPTKSDAWLWDKAHKTPRMDPTE
jgi:acyl-homoserine lactone acylase PvdQ